MSYSIIIPSKNVKNLTACLTAIVDAGETARIIVVDDGIEWDDHFQQFVEHEQHDAEAPKCGSCLFTCDPDRGTPPLYRGLRRFATSRWALIYWVKAPKPFVYARNCNIGILLAENDDVILLNDDALLKSPRGFDLLWMVSMTFPHFGIIAAACDNVGNPNQFRVYGCKGSDEAFTVRPERRMVCFVCVYIPRQVINKVGLLDERYVGYGMDDDDYSFRVRRAGFALGIYDGCYVDHKSLTSSYRGEATTGGDFRPNMKLFIKKWGTDNWERTREASEFASLFPEPESVG